MKKIVIICIVCVIVLLLVGAWLYVVKGYVTLKPRSAVPANLIYDVSIPDMPNIRLIVNPLKMAESNFMFEIAKSGLSRAVFSDTDINILVISGGGANGAYAAGALCGWTETGKRPVFEIVTGVSTGALIAPAAFLGPLRDDALRNIYTGISDKSVMTGNIIDLLFEGRPSLMDTRPLRRIVGKEINMQTMQAIAREHAKGRRLYIATTNLDAKRLVVWDMGAIASYGTPKALKIFRDVMMASASIPVAFPPVMFGVEANGVSYKEMHVDGSVVTQMFGALLVQGHDEIKDSKTIIYAIRNGKLAEVPAKVKSKIWDIAGASFATILSWQSYGELYRFASIAKDEGIDFYFACIPYDFEESRQSEFDRDYMNKLFTLGFDKAKSDDLWMKRIFSQEK